MNLISATELPPIPKGLVHKANSTYSTLEKPDLVLFDKITVIYRFMDEMEKHVSTFTTCKKGCNHCCHHNVQITVLEAEYISTVLKIPYDSSRRLTTDHETPCPFLSSGGECSIYEIRPMACRLLHALGDPENCRPGKVQALYGSPASQYGNAIYKNLAEWILYQTAQLKGPLKDIRDFFPK